MPVGLSLWALASGVLGAEVPSTGHFDAVRPILRRCVKCHKGDEPAGGLNLVRRAGALEGGESGPALTPGKPAESRLMRMVERRKMPPKAPLSPVEIEAIRSWIAAGAEWDGEVVPAAEADDEQWALRALVRPPVPPGGPQASNPIDAFVDRRLATEGLAAAPQAERATLLRRLSFDLTGLPPTPEEVDRFVADDRPEAYRLLVDRLLASPSYGERWARHWLDVARFGESHGFEFDHLRERAWPYRDYVIRSLNEDKPYPTFVREQIAGDVIDGATPDTIAATGFLVAGPWDEANKLQTNAVMRARTREEELDDMVAALGQTFLGMTVNCARCHDHKFDPIPQEDYYRFASALAGVNHGERPALPASELAAREAKLSRLHDEQARAEAEVVEIELAARRRVREAASGTRSFGPLPSSRWSFDADATDEDGRLPGRLMGNAQVEGGALRLSGQGAYLVAGPLRREFREKTLEAWVRLSDLDRRGGAVLTVQTLGGGQFDAIVFGEREPRKWLAGSENFLRSKDLDAARECAQNTIHLAVTYASDGTIAVYRDGTLYAPAYRPDEEMKVYPAGRSEVLIGLRHTGAGNGFLAGEVDEARLYDRALTEEEVAASYRAGPGGIARAEVVAALDDDERGRREVALTRAEEAARSIREFPPLPLVYAANSAEPGVTRVLARGDVERPGRPVAVGGLSAVRQPPADLGLAPDAADAVRRLRLADWITHRDNPLFWRVMANRVWHHHFGTGLVASPNDFGANGERPSHPELLDWLACELRDSGGSLKGLHRLIVTSEAYRRSSRFDPAAAARDADSRLLWRYPPRRLEGEAVRDAMLSVSGELNPAMGGPSFRPFTVKVFGSNFYTLTDPAGAEFNRRTIYRIHVLSAKSPLLDALDCPDPSTKTPRRGVTTTPLQALALMNDSFVIRQAKTLAERARREVGDHTSKQVERMYRLALGRSPTDTERQRAEALARSQGIEDVAWTLLNATEFIYVE